MQLAPVQPVSDLMSKLPEYMTPADARKEAEVIKQQVKNMYSFECTNTYHMHVNILWPKKDTFHVVYILGYTLYTCMHCGQEIIVY